MCGAPNLPPSSSKYLITYVEIRTFSHATEDQEKVQLAVKNTLPEDLAAELTFTTTTLTGHHSNPIVLLESKLTNKAALPAVLEKIASGLSPLDKETFSSELSQHIERHNLYLRFDKQNAYLGKLTISSIDPIHFKIQFKNKTPEEIEQICKQVGLIS
jgi:RNA-binding protein